MSLFYKVTWLQRMYNYLYSLYKGTVRTVNGTPPDINGNVDVSGGGGGTLQSVTTGTGNNITSNTLQLTGIDNLDLTLPSFLLGRAGDHCVMTSVNPTNNSSITLQDGGVVVLVGNEVDDTGQGALTIFGGSTGSLRAQFFGRVSGQDGSAVDEFVTLQQVQEVVDHPYKGGQSPFTADGTTTVFDITHNLGATPSFFTLTTTQPIAQNHLGRTITFPDPNTMRLTFAFPPNPGEDANYVWIVYK